VGRDSGNRMVERDGGEEDSLHRMRNGKRRGLGGRE